MILGGSPIKVAVPPIFENSTSDIRNGKGLMFKIVVIENVTGTINNTVVTLSKKLIRRLLKSIK